MLHHFWACNRRTQQPRVWMGTGKHQVNNRNKMWNVQPHLNLYIVCAIYKYKIKKDNWMSNVTTSIESLLSKKLEVNCQQVNSALLNLFWNDVYVCFSALMNFMAPDPSPKNYCYLTLLYLLFISLKLLTDSKYIDVTPSNAHKLQV